MPRCLNCRQKFTPTAFLQKFCGEEPCHEAQLQWQKEKQSKNKPKPAAKIAKMSDKRKIENLKYTAQRIVFLGKPQNRICFIEDCLKPATTIEHTAGRLGFYDDWARENNVSLYLDERFWKPCCFEHNMELENNPELSKKYQLSKIHGKEKT